MLIAVGERLALEDHGGVMSTEWSEDIESVLQYEFDPQIRRFLGALQTGDGVRLLTRLDMVCRYQRDGVQRRHLLYLTFAGIQHLSGFVLDTAGYEDMCDIVTKQLGHRDLDNLVITHNVAAHIPHRYLGLLFALQLLRLREAKVLDVGCSIGLAQRCLEMLPQLLEFDCDPEIRRILARDSPNIQFVGIDEFDSSRDMDWVLACIPPGASEVRDVLLSLQRCVADGECSDKFEFLEGEVGGVLRGGVYGSGMVDVVWVSSVLYEMYDSFETAIVRLADVVRGTLRPGGWMLVANYSRVSLARRDLRPMYSVKAFRFDGECIEAGDSGSEILSSPNDYMRYLAAGADLRSLAEFGG